MGREARFQGSRAGEGVGMEWLMEGFLEEPREPGGEGEGGDGVWAEGKAWQSFYGVATGGCTRWRKDPGERERVVTGLLVVLGKWGVIEGF